ncbi:MAG TPA: 5-formyltetrahydrofolate cyclo-ligase [bacterium]|nr:5-formyltetrahydrofolate cyclo-ligase [bacterium]
MQSKTDKTVARAWAKERRAGLTDRAAQSAAIVTRLQQLPAWQTARTICSYIAVRDEVDVNPLLRQLLAAGERQLCVPRVIGTGMMDMVPLCDWPELAPGPFGIPQPSADSAAIDPAAIDLILVPGLAFARTGARLGYGGGYYDRFLAPIPPARRIGLCFAELLRDELPEATHEARCGCIITPAATLFCM